MHLRFWLCFTACALMLSQAGCISVTAPKEVNVEGGGRPQRVDSSRIPNPQTLEEARFELRKAYENLQWMEDEVADSKNDKAKYKRDRDKYKKRLERCEDRLERYEDD